MNIFKRLFGGGDFPPEPTPRPCPYPPPSIVTDNTYVKKKEVNRLKHLGMLRQDTNLTFEDICLQDMVDDIIVWESDAVE
jgi:hypothetical protein